MARETGRDYGVGLIRKLRLVAAFRRNRRRIPTASTLVEHVIIATQILRVPPETEGCVVECGSYKGGSAANISLVCRLVGRKLHIFDSFAGLPAPADRDQGHTALLMGEEHRFPQGAYPASQAEVRANLERWGAAEVCELHPGPFSETLPMETEPCVAAFVDVDYRSSLEDCLRWLWPRLGSGGHLFTHEAYHLEIAALFFDRQWWSETLGDDPPGLVGAGNGLGLHPRPGGFWSALGYTVKDPDLRRPDLNPPME